MLSLQPGREKEAIDAYERAIADGRAHAWLNLGNLLAEQRGRRHDAEEAYRQAIAAGVFNAWFNLGLLLSRQRGREDEAIAAFRAAVAHGQGDGYGGAQNALDDQLAKQRDGTAASFGASLGRARTAVARQPWARRVTRSIWALGRFGPRLRDSSRRSRRRRGA